MRAIIFCLFLFSCTDEYADTFWSRNEQVNSCLAPVKEYWESRGETIYFHEYGMEIVVVSSSFCSNPRDACIDFSDDRIEIPVWIIDETDKLCDVIAHEVGHGIGYDHSENDEMMKARIKNWDSPIVSPSTPISQYIPEQQ